MESKDKMCADKKMGKNVGKKIKTLTNYTNKEKKMGFLQLCSCEK